jgi:hypothetical protein
MKKARHLPGFFTFPVDRDQPKRITEKKLSQAKIISRMVRVSGRFS